MFIVRDTVDNTLRYSLFSTPHVVTRCTLVDRNPVGTHNVMLLRGDDGRRYMVNVADSTAKVV